ncbi:MAG: HDOD domain-containing protein [Bryobacterales bacterium]|nr:HDOD domain-containing protein [Bryobacterales bacterium]
MRTFVARQPIIDCTRSVIGYELLYRHSASSLCFDAVDGCSASAHVISHSLFGAGLENLVSGKLAFINFTRQLLVQGFPNLLPNDSVVVEILETIHPDEEVIAACRSLKKQGYLLALDDYVHSEAFEPLLQCAAIVKFDVKSAGLVRPDRQVPHFQTRGLKALAEKIETWADFERAQVLGYSYFQGYFFARPVLVAGRRTPSLKLSQCQLLEAVQHPDLDFAKIERIIKQDVSLSYKLLRYINSARFARPITIDSIGQSLLLLGEVEVRRWASLLLLCSLGENKTRELVILALVRARFCELLGEAARMPDRKASLFLMGMFSLLDALLDANLEEALQGLPLDKDVTGALLGRSGADSRFSSTFQLVCDYEAADWPSVSRHALFLHIPEDFPGVAYTTALQWAESVLS